MKLSVSPDVVCRLERQGRAAELTSSELAALRDCFADTGRTTANALPKPLMRTLFELGILLPDAILDDRGADHWKHALPDLALSPYLELRPTFVVAGIQIDRIEPATALFLDPLFVDGMQELSRVVNAALDRVTNAAAIRGMTLPRERTIEMLRDVAAAWMESHPDVRRWFRCTPGSDLALGEDATPALDACDRTTVNLRISVEKRSATIALPLSSMAELACAMDALREGPCSLEDTLNDSAVRQALGAIESVGGFVRRSGASPSLDVLDVLETARSDEALAITHMGHAFLIADAGDRRILFDPVLFPWSADFEVQPLTSRQLGSVDGIFLTHHHEDHMMAAALMTLPHDVPVFVPKHSRAPMTPRYSDYLHAMGFRDVRELDHGETYDAGGGLEIEALPFTGEARNLLGFGANCYRVARHGRSVLVHADASPDSDGRSLLTDESLHSLVRAKGSIDIVFGTWWQERQFVCQVSPLALFQRMDRWLDSTEMCDCSHPFLVDLVRASGASLFVTYAESGPQCFVPRERMSEYIPSVSLLWKSQDEVRETIRRETGAGVIAAEPYMRFVMRYGGQPPTIVASAVAPSRRSAG